MVILGMIAELTANFSNSIYNLFFASLLLLVINPIVLFHPGFIMSFGATFGIITLSKPITNFLRRKIPYQKLSESLGVTLAAQVFLFPILIYFYHHISIISLFVNLLIMPFVGIIIILGFITIIISFLSITLAKVPAFFLTFLIQIIIKLTAFISKIKFSNLTLITPSLLFFLLYYLSIFILISKNKWLKENRKKIFLIFLIIFIMLHLSYLIPKNHIQISVIDVGQGDAIFIRTPSNKTVLMDGGGSAGEDTVGENILLPYLLYQKVNRIDFMMISHMDNDHVGGLFTIMNELKVNTVIISEQKEDSKNYQKFQKIVKEKNIKVIYVGRGDRLKIDQEVYFDFLWPSQKISITENVLNNHSIVCKLHYHNFSMLFTGDIEEPAEKEILKEYQDNFSLLKATLLKVAHHGSKTSSTVGFIEAVKPQLAVIGVGENNKFGHPNDIVIERLEKLRCQNIPHRQNGRNRDNSK